MSYRFAGSLQADQDGMSWSCLQAVSKPVWHIPLLCVQWKTPDDGQRNCLTHVEFYSKNKFEKLVHLVGFIIRMRATVFVLHGMRRLTFSHLMYFILTKMSIYYNNKLSYFLYIVRLFHTFTLSLEIQYTKYQMPNTKHRTWDTITLTSASCFWPVNNMAVKCKQNVQPCSILPKRWLFHKFLKSFYQLLCWWFCCSVFCEWFHYWINVEPPLWCSCLYSEKGANNRE